MAINSFPIETTTVDVSSFQETLDNFTQYGSGARVSSINELRSQNIDIVLVDLVDGPASGVFCWQAGDFTDRVNSDVRSAVFVSSASIPPL